MNEHLDDSAGASFDAVHWAEIERDAPHVPYPVLKRWVQRLEALLPAVRGEDAAYADALLLKLRYLAACDRAPSAHVQRHREFEGTCGHVQCADTATQFQRAVA